MVDGEAGKGSKYRPIDQRKWDEGWEIVFGEKNKTKVTIKNKGEITPKKENKNE